MTDEWTLSDTHNLLEEQRAQTKALEEIAEQMAIQNGALLAQARALEKLVGVEFNGNPDNAATTKALANTTADSVLDIAEQVDLDEARRWADD